MLVIGFGGYAKTGESDNAIKRNRRDMTWQDCLDFYTNHFEFFR